MEQMSVIVWSFLILIGLFFLAGILCLVRALVLRLRMPGSDEDEEIALSGEDAGGSKPSEKIRTRKK